MEIRLTRKVEVNSYEAIMKIGTIKDDFSFYIPILELARKNGFLNHRAINEELLFINPENAMGKNIIEKLENYGFIIKPFEGEDVYDLTGQGKVIFQNLQYGNFTAIDSQIIQVLKKLEFVNSFNRIFSNEYDLTEKCKEFIESRWPIKSSPAISKVCEELVLIGILKKINTFNRFLTEMGKDSLERGIVKIPETGPFIIHTTLDPLFSEAIIGYDKPKENVHNEYQDLYNRSRNGKETKNGDNSETPEWLKEYQSRSKNGPVTIKLAAMEKEEIDIHNIDNQVLQTPGTLNVSSTLHISDRKAPTMMVKESSEEDVQVNHEFDLEFTEVLKQLFKNREEKIRKISGKTVILVSYDGLSPAEKSSFKKNFTIKKPEIRGFGTFDDVDLKNMAISPITEEDALKWAKWLLIDGINDFLDEKRYEEIKEECALKFIDCYDSANIMEKLPTFDGIVREFSEKRSEEPEKYWFVAMPRFLTARREAYGN